MTKIVESGSKRERRFTVADGKSHQMHGPLAAVLGQELHVLEQRDADLQAEGKQSKRRDVQERIAELQDGIAAVRPPSRTPMGR